MIRGLYMKYRSKVDWWVHLALLPLFPATVWVIWLYFTEDSSATMLWAGVAPMILTLVLIVWIYASTYYRFDDDMLYIRCGPFRVKVAYGEITGVRQTRSPWSSMALSLDRIEIKYGSGKVVMISPKQKQDFLEQLEFRRRA